MPKDVFCKSYFTIQYILENKIKATTLADTYSIRYGFINEKFVEIICQILEIKPQRLIKIKKI